MNKSMPCPGFRSQYSDATYICREDIQISIMHGVSPCQSYVADSSASNEYIYENRLGPNRHGKSELRSTSSRCNRGLQSEKKVSERLEIEEVLSKVDRIVGLPA